MTQKKNISVIGCGHWGKNLIRNFADLGRLHSVSDTNSELGLLLAEKYKVPFKDFDEIICSNDVYGVVIAAPAIYHSKLAVTAMNAGKHVFVEKPMAMNLADAKEMIKVSDTTNSSLMVGHLLQYHPVFKKLRNMAKEDYFGKLKYIYSNRLSLGKIRSEEDVVLSFSPHDISMILSLSDSEPISLKRDSISILQNGIDDVARINIEFADGVTSDINVSWINPVKEQKLVIVGEKGMGVFDDTLEWNKKLMTLKYKIDLGNFSISKDEIKYIKVHESEPLREECSSFCDVVDGKSKPLTNGLEGYKVLSILQAAEKAKSGKRITI